MADPIERESSAVPKSLLDECDQLIARSLELQRSSAEYIEITRELIKTYRILVGTPRTGG